jgi:hypothetical protein
MTTNQPLWRRIANLGDVNPVEYGGFFVYIDRRGVYQPEVELLEAMEEYGGKGWETYRAIIEKNPEQEWWYSKLDDVARSCGQDADEYRATLAGDDVIAKARVYQDMIGYFGAHEFDSYPRQYEKRSELPRRFKR